MTNLPPADPMSRRERRLLEQQSLQAQAAAAASQPVYGTPAPSSVSPLVPPGAFYPPPHTGPALTVSTPIPVVTTPAPPAFLETAPRALSRRELRQAQQANQEMSVPSVAPPGLAPSVAYPPLPPVFGVSPGTQPVSQPVSQPIAQPMAQPMAQHTPAPYLSPETFPTAVAGASRTVGDVLPATSSLILPTTPTVDMTSPLNSTGEVVVTGQIFLPPRFAESGTAPLLEPGVDQDEVMDAYVTGEMVAMSKPMRASQAVSGKGDDTDILLVRRARWGKAAVITALTAVSLGFVALGLLVLVLLEGVVE